MFRSWTFGSPRVGNLAWQKTFNSVVKESWRFTHNRDIVPSLPPELMGFRHLAREVCDFRMQRAVLASIGCER